MEDQQFTTVEPGQFVLSSESDYVTLPDGEPLKAHITKIEVTQDRKFDSEELEDKLVVRFVLDEDIEGKGQVYTAWFRPSVNPKSKMFKMAVAVYEGKVPAPFDVTDLLGRPVRMLLTPSVEKNGRSRQYIDSYLKPTAGQERVAVPAQDIILAELPDAGINLDDVFKD